MQVALQKRQALKFKYPELKQALEKNTLALESAALSPQLD
jgi:hypothetical protein